MNLILHYPAALGPNQVRLRAAPPPCAQTACLRIEGVARLSSSRSLKRIEPRTEYARVGTHERQLSHEHVPGWHIALRLKAGEHYVAEVFECLARVRSTQELPLDEATPDEIVFFNIARPLKRQDPFDMRRSLQGFAGVWTDGVMVRCADGVAGPLRFGTAYKVVVRKSRLPS